MTKKDLKVKDEWKDFDYDNLDFSLDDSKGTPPNVKSKTRKAVDSIATGAYGEVKSKLKNPRFYRETVKKAFPDTFGVIDDAVDTTAKSMFDLYNEIAREEKPKFKRIAGKLASMLPDEDSRIKKFLKKIEGEERSGSYNRESSDEASIQATLGEIFKAQEARGKLDQAKELVRDRASNIAQSKSLDVLNRIYQETASLSRYNTSITQGFQRKSLELQLRSYLLQAETSRRTLDFLSIFKAQFEGMVKNTALPEYAKLTEFERIKERGKNILTDKLYGDGSMIKKGMNKLTDSVRSAAQGFSFGLSNAEMGVEGIANMREQIDELNQTFIESGMEPMSKLEIAAAAAAGGGMSWVQDAVAKRLKKHTSNAVREKMAAAARVIQSPGRAIKKKLGSDEWENAELDVGAKGKAYKFGRWFLEHFMESKESSNMKKSFDPKDLDSFSKGGITNKANLSLTTVIPGYLAGIQREIAMLRTGQDQPLFKYDYKRGDFVTEKSFDKSIMSDLEKTAKTSMYGYKVSSVASYVDPERKLSGEEELLLKIFISKISRLDNFDYSIKAIHETDAFKALPANVKKVVDDFFNDMDTSEETNQKYLEFENRIIAAKQSMGNLSREIGEKISEGGAGVMKKKGLITDTQDFSGYKIDPEKLAEFLENSTFFGSDIKIKNRIKPTSPENILSGKNGIDWGAPKGKMSGLNAGKKNLRPSEAFEAFKRTKLYDWFYNASKKDGKQHSGPMAGDVRRAFGEDAAPGGEGIDLQEMNAAYFASTQHIDKRLNKLEGTGKTSPILGIKDDTSKIVQLLSSGFGFRLPGIKDLTKGVASKWNTFRESAGDFDKDAAGKMADTASSIKDNYIKPGIDGMIEFYNKHKDPAKNKIIGLFDSAVDMAQGVVQRGSDFFSNTLPNAASNLQKFLSKAYNRAKDAYLEYRDIYVTGDTEPVLRGIKISAGEYYNKVTGTPILTMKEVLECKDDIIDKAGNIILSVKDRANGLIDSSGKPFLSGIDKLASSAGEMARYGFQRLSSAAMQLFGLGKEGAGKLKDFFKNFKTGFGGFGSGSTETHTVIVDIRDILLGRKKKVLARMKKEKEETSDITEDKEPSGGQSSESTAASDSTESNKAETDTSQRYEGVGSGGLFGAANSVVDKIRGLKDSKLGKKVGRGIGRIKNSGMFSKLANSKMGGRFGKLLGGAGALVSGAATAAGSLMADSGDGQKQPGIDWGAPKGQMYQDGEKVGVLQGLANKAKNKLSGKDRAWNDNDADGDRDGGIDDQREQQEKLHAERTKNKATTDTSQRYAGADMGGLMGMAGKLFAFLTSGVTSLFGIAGKVLSKIPGLAGLAAGAGKAVSSFFGKGLIRGAASLAGKGLMGAARFALPMAANAAFAAGSAILSGVATVAGSVMTVLSAPVVIGAMGLAAAGYLVYKLYNYANRDNANNAEIARLRQYGFCYNTSVQRYNHYVYMLEAYLLDNRVGMDGGSARILSKKVDPKEILQIFEIDENDKERVSAFTGWLENRFKPVFLTHVAALYKANKKPKLSDMSKIDRVLTPEEAITYLEAARFASGPYSYDISPVRGMEALDVNSGEILKNFDDLIVHYQALSKAKSSKVKVDIKTPAADKAADQTASQKVLSSVTDKDDEASRQKKYMQDYQQKRKNSQASGQGMSGESDDGGKKPNEATGKDSDSVSPGSPPGAIPLAKGGPVDGSNGMKYIRLGPNAKLDGIDPGFAKLFFGMAAEYGELTGKQINVNSGIRSYADQARLHQQDPAKAAAPGKSLHEFGLAIDINQADANQLEKLGLMKKYGFTRPIGQEPWHIEPAGIQTNIDAAKKDPSLRAAMVQASLFKGGGGYGTMSNATKYRRNPKLAAELLNASGQPVDPATMSQLTSQLGLDKSGGDKTVPAQISGDMASKTAQDSGKAASGAVASKSTSGTGALASTGSSTAGGGASAGAGTGSSAGASGVTPACTSGGSAAGGTDKTMNGSSSDVISIIKKAAAASGIDPNILIAFAATESSLNPNAKVSEKGAKGLMQFTKSTWDETLMKYGPKHKLGQDTSIFDPYASAVLGGEYLKTNMKSLSKVKPDLNATDAYLTHFLGPGGAVKFLSADTSEIAAKVRPDAAANNKNIFYDKSGTAKTVGQVYEDLTNKLKEKAKMGGVSLNITGLKSKGGEEGKGSTGGADASLPSGGGTPPASLGASASSAAPGSSSSSSSGSNTKSSGILLDSRGSDRSSSTATGSPVAMPAAPGAGAANEKTNEILTDSLAVLKGIERNSNPETLAKILAAMISSIKETAKPADDDKDMKKKDQKNMGRNSETTRSSLDLGRYSS